MIKFFAFLASPEGKVVGSNSSFKETGNEYNHGGQNPRLRAHGTHCRDILDLVLPYPLRESRQSSILSRSFVLCCSSFSRKFVKGTFTCSVKIVVLKIYVNLI